MGDQPDDLPHGAAADLERDVAFALSQHARSFFRFAKHGDTAPASIAALVVGYLRLANWKFRRGDPAPPHSTSPQPRRPAEEPPPT